MAWAYLCIWRHPELGRSALPAHFDGRDAWEHPVEKAIGSGRPYHTISSCFFAVRRDRSRSACPSYLEVDRATQRVVYGSRLSDRARERACNFGLGGPSGGTIFLWSANWIRWWEAEMLAPGRTIHGLKAQAVAARSYALAAIIGPDLCRPHWHWDTTRCRPTGAWLRSRTARRSVSGAPMAHPQLTRGNC